MKKIILIALLGLFSLMSFGQAVGTYDKKMDYTVSWSQYVGTSTDVLTVADSTWSYTIFKNSYKPLKYDVYLKLDRTGGTNNVVHVYLKAKKWDEQAAWTTLKTVNWTGASDTVIVLTESSTAGQYKYYKLDMVGANNTLLASILDYFIIFWE
jgi:hypothetical protein